MNYLVNFKIPQGITGPTGPTGPTPGLNAYGGRYSNTSQTLNLIIGSSTVIPLANNMPNKATSYTTNNSITTNEAGVYEINYFVNLSATVATTITLAVRRNGTNIDSTALSRALTVGTGTIYNGSIIVSLNANETIDMALSALLAANVTLGSGVNASLTIKKLNN